MKHGPLKNGLAQKISCSTGALVEQSNRDFGRINSFP